VIQELRLGISEKIRFTFNRKEPIDLFPPERKKKEMRRRLRERREAETYAFEFNGQKYVATISRFQDGAVAELFLNSAKRHSTEQDDYVRDAAVAVSLALQHGCPLQVLKASLCRGGGGEARGPIAAALDLVEEWTPQQEQ
jgi:ribonucleoside-diphosphate reductase alpha chain